MSIEASQHVNTLDSQERPLVFMGGLGYDEARNREVATAIISLTNHTDVISIPDSNTTSPNDSSVVHKYSHGGEQILPGKVALKYLDDDPSLVRFTQLHERRANELIEQIEKFGEVPVDAVFQSVDVSTGILAMHKRPELFRRVVLLDPSSIIKLPTRLKYLKEEWRNGNLFDILKRRKGLDYEKFEQQVNRREKVKRSRRSSSSGNKIASYISSQAPMLHDIAESENAPVVSIVASRFDHAYTPQRLIQALVSLKDINSFFITNYRHGLGGRKAKLEQLVGVLTGENEDLAKPFTDRLRFAEGIAEEYKQKILAIISSRSN